MTMEKKFDSKQMSKIGETSKYPIGFSYVLNGELLEVTQIITIDANSPMRRLRKSDGTFEDVEILTIDKDLKSGAQIIDEGKQKDVSGTIKNDENRDSK